MSAVPPKKAILFRTFDVRFVPEADIRKFPRHVDFPSFESYGSRNPVSHTLSRPDGYNQSRRDGNERELKAKTY